MIIYDVENFPNPLRVRIALAEKNAKAYLLIFVEHLQKMINPNVLL